MSKKRSESASNVSSSRDSLGEVLRKPADPWQAQVALVMERFNREYRRESFDLPEAVEAMPVFQEWMSGALQARVASPFWELAQPQKNQHWLDLGCGVSFLIYPWRDWGALFHGQEVSSVARDLLNARGPQLNSKLFKGVELAPAHQLKYETSFFDGAIATGLSCYYPIDYWKVVMAEVKRVLKPGSFFVFDVINPEAPLAENWAILETYLGAEVFLESLSDWKQAIQEAGGKVIKSQAGELFQLFKVKF